MLFGYLSVLFTGKYPQSLFDFNLNFMRWQYRVMARLFLMADGYPAFGLNAKDDAVILEVENKGVPISKAWIRFLFGFFFVMIPHGIALMFYSIPMIFVLYLSLIFAIIIAVKGSYPKSVQEYVVGVVRWGLRVNLYMSLMTDDYPPFMGAQTEGELNAQSISSSSDEELLDA